jgi:ABC-type oligopeptide transport system substrate-binding subunit
MKTRILFLFLAAASLSLLLTDSVSAQSVAPVRQVAEAQALAPGVALNLNLVSEPTTLDPAKADWLDNVSFSVIDQLFVGLVRLDDTTLGPQPALAESWTVSPDGTLGQSHITSVAQEKPRDSRGIQQITQLNSQTPHFAFSSRNKADSNSKCNCPVSTIDNLVRLR